MTEFCTYFTQKISALSSYGDFGLGTLEGSNGEVLFLDGVIYHTDETGKVRRLTGDEWTPYAAVTRFDSDQEFSLEAVSDEQVKAEVLKKISHNLFAAVKSCPNTGETVSEIRRDRSQPA